MSQRARRAGLLGGLATALMVACSGGERGEDVGMYGEALVESLVLSEIKADPSGANTNGEQFIELRGTPSGNLSDYFLAVVQGGGGMAAGTAGLVVNFESACAGAFCSLGTNGLLIVKKNATAAGATTVVVEDSPNYGFTGSSSVLLILSPTTPIGEDTDYDPDNDGDLDLPDGASIVDSIGWRTNAANAVYGGAAITLAVAGDGPDALTRFPNDNTKSSVAAWYHGELTTGTGTTTYDLARSSSNTPAGAALTPAVVNFDAPSGGAGGAGGMGGAGGVAGEAGEGGVPPINIGGAGGFDGIAGAGSGGDDTGIGGLPEPPAGGSGGEPSSVEGGSGGVPSETAGAGGAPVSPSGGQVGVAGALAVAGSTTGGTTGGGGSAGTVSTAGRAGGPGAAGEGGDDGGGDGGGDDDDGCGCRTPGRGSANNGALAALALAFGAVVRRRRKSR